MSKPEWAKDQWAMSSSNELSWIILLTYPTYEWGGGGRKRVTAKKGLVMLFVLRVTQARTHFRIGILSEAINPQMYLNQFCLIKNIISKRIMRFQDYYFNVYFILRVKYYLVNDLESYPSLSFEHQVFPHSWTTLSSSYHLSSLSISSLPCSFIGKKWQVISLSSLPLVKTTVFLPQIGPLGSSVFSSQWLSHWPLLSLFLLSSFLSGCPPPLQLLFLRLLWFFITLDNHNMVMFLRNPSFSSLLATTPR